MNNPDAVLDLLTEWEEQRQLGRTLSPDELCPDDEALRDELKARIERRKRMHAVLDAPPLSPDEKPQLPGSAAPPALPKVEGFEILSVLGHGGMGVVYKARQIGLNRLVALKMILAGANASPQDLARFRAEAEAVAQLQHQNIVQIYEIGEQSGCPFLALEYVGGGSLAEHLSGTPVSSKQAAELVLSLAKAVQHAHEKGIVHRDLKPANVLLQADGTPKITDFGLAKRSEPSQAHTQTGAILGSPSYMSPEQAAGRAEQIGPPTDIYALGVILYEMLTGRPPFKGLTLIDTIEQVRENDPVPPRFLQPKIPRDLETICLKCLEKKPERRYETASVLAADLRAFLAGDAIQAHSDSLLDQVARTITHNSFDERFRGFANRMALFGPIPLIVHLIAWYFFAGKPYYATAMVTTTACMLFTLLPLLLISGMPTMRLVPRWQRKHFMTVWISHMVAMAVILIVMSLAAPAGNDRWLLMVYPLWAATAAVSFLAHATEAGIYYMIGAIIFCLAIVMALTPTWAPLEVATLMTLNMTGQGLYLRKLTTAKPSDADRLAVATATTIQSME